MRVYITEFIGLIILIYTYFAFNYNKDYYVNNYSNYYSLKVINHGNLNVETIQWYNL